MVAEHRRPLRRRLAIVLIALTLGAGGSFVGVAVAAYLWLERSMLDDVLGHELDFDTASGILPSSTLRAGNRVRLYRPKLDAQAAPAALADLAPGSYLDVPLGDSYFHVLVRDVGPGDRAWLLYNVEDFEVRERRALMLLLAGVAGAAVLSWLIGGWAARHTLRPLDSLVARIAALRADAHERLPATVADGELAAIVGAVNRMLSQIQTLVDREQAFAGAAAHELRTPITSIRLAAELLEAGPAASSAPLLRIQRAVNTASQDLDALLALSTSRQLPASEPVQLQEWMLTLRDIVDAAAAENATRLQWQAAPVVLDLPLAPLRIIVFNLLRNALRAAPGGTVSVELTAQYLAVVDDGCGIPADLLAQIFEPGTRGADGGSGIGLYIAHTLAERYGWQLRISSEAGQGTRAELRF